MITSVFFGAFVFSYVLTVERVPHVIADMLQASEVSKLQFLLVVNITLLVLGAFMEATAVILVVVPLLHAHHRAPHINPVHFGIVVTLNLTIGLITPPYGMVLFVVSGVNRIPFRPSFARSGVFIAVLISALPSSPMCRR